MLFIVFHLVKNLIKNIIAPFRCVSDCIKQNSKVLIDFGTNMCIYQPVGKAHVGINHLFYFLGESLTLVIDDQRVYFAVCTILKVMNIAHMHQYIVKGFLLKCKSEFTKTLFILA